MTGRNDREILEQRAQQLARPALKLELDVRANSLIVFQRGAGRYALETRFVHEVVTVIAQAELPGMPDYCLGVAAARGELLALFDLAVLLGEPRNNAPVLRMLLCGEEHVELAIAIDSALTLADLRPLFAAPASASTLLAGVHPDGFAVIDGTALLSDPRLMLAPTAQEKTS